MDSVSRIVAEQVAAVHLVAEQAYRAVTQEGHYDAANLLSGVVRQLQAIHEMVRYDALEEEEALHAQLRMHDYEQHAQAVNPPPPF